MSHSSLRRMAVAFCSLLLGGAICAAQEGEAPGTPIEQEPVPAKSAPAPTRSEPIDDNGISERMEIYWVLDGDGNLQPLLNIPLERIEGLLREQRGAAHTLRPAPYSIQKLSISGTADRKNADLRVQLQIVVRSDEWTGVPLRLDGAIMKAPAEHPGPGQMFLQAEPAGKGYVAYFHGEAGQQHDVTLNLLVPLTATGRETRLRLQAPRATLSDLSLTVPLPDAIATVSEGADLDDPVADDGSTQFNVRGIGGDFQLAWHRAGPRPQVPVQLEAVGAVLTRIGSRSVEASAVLTVRSYGAPFNGFDVVLPPGARLAETTPPVGCTVEVLDEADDSAKQPQVVAVRLEKPTAGPLEVGISTTRPHPVAEPTEALEVAGFQVPGAVRQWGHVAIAAISDWQVNFGGVRGVVRTDELPEALKHPELVAGYEYVGQPYSLPIRLGPRKTRISVEPRYRLLVDAGRMNWNAALKYTIRGAKAFELSVELPDWEPDWLLDEVGPANLIDVDRATIRAEDGKPAVLRLPLKQATAGAVDIQFTAHRLLAAESKKVSAALPQPLADSVAPAVLTVLPAENVRLTPDDEAISNLTRQTTSAAAEPAARPELSYRSVGGAATFVADYGVHSQQVTVDVASHVDLTNGSATVRQELQYTIAYEPAGELAVDVPRALAEAPRLEFRCDDQVVDPTRAKDDGEDAPVRMLLPLPKARLGACRISVQYPIEVPPLSPGRETTFAIPLVMPAAGDLIDSRLEIAAGGRLSVKSDDSRWVLALATDDVASPANRMELHSREPVPLAKLRLKLEDGVSTGALVVERAWIQTWLTQDARQDRAVFALHGGRRELRLHVPAEAGLGQLQLRLDGEPVSPRNSQDGTLVVSLPHNADNDKHVLEFWSLLPQERVRPGRIAIELPHLDDDVWIRHMYWQLVLPQNEHVLLTPKGLTGEFRWDFDRLVWRREPLLNQAALEAWVGAPARTPVAQGTNRYLFSGLGAMATCEIRTADRSWIVLIASGAALVVGLLLMYVPRSRHPATLLVAAAVMLSVGLIWPEPTVLFAQAASLGLALTLLAGLLERGVARRRRAGVFPEPPASAVLDKGSTETLYQPRTTGSSAPPSTTPPGVSSPNSGAER